MSGGPRDCFQAGDFRCCSKHKTYDIGVFKGWPLPRMIVCRDEGLRIFICSADELHRYSGAPGNQFRIKAQFHGAADHNAVTAHVEMVPVYLSVPL